MRDESEKNIVILDEASFMRGKLHGKESNLQKYANLVIGHYSFGALLKYELIIFFLGGLNGSVGLVLRKMLFPRLFLSVGKGVVFGRNVTIRCGKNIVIGDNVVIDDYSVLDGRGCSDTKITIGDNVVLNRGCVIQSKLGSISLGEYSTVGAGSVVVSQGEGVTIGRWVGIAGGCEISGGLFKHQPASSPEVPPFVRYTRGPVTLGDNTILAYGAIVIDGVTIGKNCMVGPGCVVISDLPDDAVISNRPGVVLKR